MGDSAKKYSIEALFASKCIGIHHTITYIHTYTHRADREKEPEYYYCHGGGGKKYGNLIKLLPFLSFCTNDLCVLSCSLVARSASFSFPYIFSR